MHIQIAEYFHFDELVAIGYKFFEFNPYRQVSFLNESSLRTSLKDLLENHILLVAIDNKKVIGTAAAFVAPVYWNYADLQGLEAFWWVDKEHRASGIGRQLRVQLQDIAKERGVKFWNMIALKESMHDEVCASYERDGMTHVETVYMKVL